ncbi:MAG: nitrogenase [Kastovskya adunca ATA6-11-RM4]|nr:nitrogenase [Kastovskya adunca ATA6-11-RM4]
MTSLMQSFYTEEQVAAWLRGLLTIAWADGDFDQQEQDFIAQLTQEELGQNTDLNPLQTIAPEELADLLGNDSSTGENFLRTAVMVALADGVYSALEAEVLHQFSEALGQKIESLESLKITLYDGDSQSLVAPDDESATEPGQSSHPHSDVLQPVREWLDEMEINDPRVAKFLGKLIPAQCPFERDVKLFGRKIVHIPPLCKINPLYEQLVGLRFRALCYLADDCGEDISSYS